MAKKPEIARQEIYARRTHRYNTAYQGDDLWTGPHGMIRLLKRHAKSWDRDGGEGYRQSLLVAIHSPLTNKQLKEILPENFTYSCQCEHDCCGHAHCFNVDVRRIKRREYLITQYVGHNC